jgi:hypothetical protein
VNVCRMFFGSYVLCAAAEEKPAETGALLK